jgi:hypothetical protein
VSTTPAMKQLQNISLSTPQNEYKVKTYCMSENINLTASQQNKKKLPVKKYFHLSLIHEIT